MLSETMSTPASWQAPAIAEHYDRPPALYELFLDQPWMSYTCALWEDGDTLEQAQVRKLTYHAEQANARNARRVLDLGCGWGSQLRFLLEHFGVERAIGVTVAREQKAYIDALGDPRLQIHLTSWEDYVPDEPVDAIIALGSIEHFVGHDVTPGEKLATYRRLFEKCASWLRPGGQMSLQMVTYEDFEKKDFSSFFKQEIFPESDIPRAWEIFAAADRLFEPLQMRMDRAHYVKTLDAWNARLMANARAAVECVGEETVHRYSKYFKMANIGFHLANMNLMRISFRKLPSR